MESMETQALSKRQIMLPRNIQGVSVREEEIFQRTSGCQ